ncbi:MAG: hypothetical protein JO078_04450 [Candidatus Eremiobacteraeota bacterium]|nr:hypothetical protein [Candidatus Eremiobacteraeota bacterium]MBV9055547.1 hypothetical protein [Candidatus Eremiobacteraeota bacterium]MBV9699357.1 hypothetical protein [Candidatus Eremiobacteraeota bacterium]
MPIDLHEVRSRAFHGTKRRIYHLLDEMGTSGDQIWPFASQPFMRSPGPLTPGRTEEWHLGMHAVLEEAVPEDRIVWRFRNEGLDGTHGFFLSTQGKETLLEYRVDAVLSDTDGRLLWRRFEDQFERSTEALFDKLARVLKR